MDLRHRGNSLSARVSAGVAPRRTGIGGRAVAILPPVARNALKPVSGWNRCLPPNPSASRAANGSTPSWNHGAGRSWTSTPTDRWFRIRDTRSSSTRRKTGRPITHSSATANCSASSGRTFTPEQQQWLDRIQQHLTENLSIEREDFDVIPTLEGAGEQGVPRQTLRTVATTERSFGGVTT